MTGSCRWWRSCCRWCKWGFGGSLSQNARVGHTGGVSRPDDVELANDLVGVASARLFAAGVSRGDRLGSLRLLGVLSTVADADHRIRRPLGDVAAEFDLPPALASQWAAHLEAVGVIRRDGTTTVLGGAEPPYLGALRLHDFLDAAAELDEAPRRRDPARLLRPVGAVLAAAAVVVAILLAPGIVHPSSTPASSTGDAPATPTTTESITSPSTSTSGGRTAPSTRHASPGTSVAPSGGSVIVTTTTSTLLAPCPSGVPLLQVLGSTTDPTGNLAVDGVVRNASDTDMTIDAFTVHATIAGQQISTPGTDHPLLVPAHSSTLWHAALPVQAPAGTPVVVTLDQWGWSAPNVPSTCPAP